MFVRVALTLLAFVLAGTAYADPATGALDALVAAYPELLARHDGTNIYWRDGTVMRASYQPARRLTHSGVFKPVRVRLSGSEQEVRHAARDCTSSGL